MSIHAASVLHARKTESDLIAVTPVFLAIDGYFSQQVATQDGLCNLSESGCLRFGERSQRAVLHSTAPFGGWEGAIRRAADPLGLANNSHVWSSSSASRSVSCADSLWRGWGVSNAIDETQVLAQRMDTKASVSVTLLLNIQRKRGDTTAAEQLVRRFADRFWNTDWPGSSKPRVYYDPRALELEGPAGVLHAKAVVIDDEVVFVTSANLTEAALNRNIELGLLVRDHALAASVSTHFRTLIERGLLLPLPAA